MSDPKRDQEETFWPRGWAEHELAQLRRLAQLPFSEKLEWLEQAHRVVLHLSKARTAQNPIEGGDPRPPEPRPGDSSSRTEE
jgi:hypothetical protein